MNDPTSTITLQTHQNFDLSVIISLDEKQWIMFVQLFPSMVNYYQRNGIEIILVIEEIVDRETVFEFIKQFPMIDWKILQCTTISFAQKINLGIRQSSKQYILLLRSEWEFKSDVIYYLRNKMDFYPGHYAIGQIEEGKPNAIMAPKDYFEQVGGMNETIYSEIYCFDNLQRRMELANIRRLFCPEALLIQHNNSFFETQLSRDKILHLLLPNEFITNQENWGCMDYTLLYDWRNNPFAKEQCNNYLLGFVDHYIADSDIFNRNYKLIALIPTYQESERIIDCLRSVEKHCDGIIVLDDESTDNTYELVQSEKLLLKARKKRTEFNDKHNRNILLDLAYFFRSEWFIFIDADERFNERFMDLPKTMNLPAINTVGVWIANLWDSLETYRADMMDSNPFSKNGLWLRWRMFRNIGRMQIIGTKRLHFNSIPYSDNRYISKTLLLHLGYLTEKKRNLKYAFYKKEDKEDNLSDDYYNDILSKTIEIKHLDSLSLDHL